MTGISDRMWPTLENLTIINADLGKLTSNMFSQYRYLKRLHLEAAGVTGIERNAFSGLPRLQLLRLFGNSIDRLDSFSFSNLLHAKEIYLTDNNIKRIGKNAFHSSSHLGTLDLRNNPVQKLERGALNGLRHVDRLLLPSEMILIEPGAFENLTDVHYLEIRQWKPRETRWQGVAPHTFRGLKNVKTLQIEKSDLGVIHQFAFEGLSNVEYVYIRNSMITRIRKRGFFGMHKVRRLGLTKNLIDHIDFMALFYDRTAIEEQNDHHRRRHGVEQLDINKNRLNCSCPKNAWILYDQHVVNNFTSILRNNTCDWPPELNGLDLYVASTRIEETICKYGDDGDNAGTVRLSWIVLISSVLWVTLFRYDFLVGSVGAA